MTTPVDSANGILDPGPSTSGTPSRSCPGTPNTAEALNIRWGPVYCPMIVAMRSVEILAGQLMIRPSSQKRSSPFRLMVLTMFSKLRAGVMVKGKSWIAMSPPSWWRMSRRMLFSPFATWTPT